MTPTVCGGGFAIHDEPFRVVFAVHINVDLRDELKTNCRFHDFSHYNASIMLALGVPDKYACERMVYSATDTLKKVYQRIFKGKRKEVADTGNTQMKSKFEIMTQEKPILKN